MVTHDVAAYALVVGVPARRVGWMSAQGHRLELPSAAPPGQVLQATCPATGQRYRLQDECLQALTIP